MEEVAVEAKESKPEQELVPDEPQLESMARPLALHDADLMLQ